ncbi:MAG: hypothetical protein QM311_07105 [Acidobacteriota bacterium]|jgi:hypothetical protein|nr:hypothetical protein [Acidobacteriota bacterium]
MNHRPIWSTLACALALVLLTGSSAFAGVREKLGGGRRAPREARYKTFLDSDDYRDGEEVVGAFLTDADYGRMVEDLQYRGVTFDWGWVLAEGDKRHKPATLGFSISSYRTVHVAPVRNVAGKIAPGIEKEVHDVLTEAMRQLGLEMVAEPDAADLVLGAAVVDYKADGTYIFFAVVDPYVELEIRLHDRGAGQDLLLVRHRDHNKTPALGAADTAGDLVRFLR